MIPYGRHSISEEDISAVVNVLRSEWITQGPSINQFESALASYCGADHAVAVSNATAALHLSCLALDVGPGAHVWTSPNSFLASANCALYCGATVDFVDINPCTYNLDVTALEKKLYSAKLNNRLPSALIVVHFAGQSCDMAAIAELGNLYGFRIIEDASHAIGADYLDTKVGSCKYSDLTVFSFHPVKILTTGEGGVILTNQPKLKEKLISLRSHGVVRDPALLQQQDQGGWFYEQQMLGFNYRMTDIQAALGLSQLQRVDTFVSRRRSLAKRYDELLAPLPVITPFQNPDGNSAYHLYPIWINEAIAGKTRRYVYDFLRDNQIQVNVHYIPIHLQPYYQELGFVPGQFPAAEYYYSGAISLPLFYDLTESDQDFVVDILKLALA